MTNVAHVFHAYRSLIHHFCVSLLRLSPVSHVNDSCHKRMANVTCVRAVCYAHVLATHVAVHCNTCCSPLQHMLQSIATHVAVHCMLQHCRVQCTATHVAVLQRGAYTHMSRTHSILIRVCQCVAVCVSVLQCVSVCCRVFQCVAVCGNALCKRALPKKRLVI